MADTVESIRWFAKKPCVQCPFRRDVKPFLHPERAEEIAYAATNPCSDFPCHKTLDDDEDGELVETAGSLTCAGFLAMQINAGRDTVDDFTMPEGVYFDPDEMIDAYAEAWTSRRRKQSKKGN